MFSFDLIPGLPQDIVLEHIMPKVLMPILSTEIHPGSMMTRPQVVTAMKECICIYKYMGISGAWRANLRHGSVYNSMRLAVCKMYIDYDHDFAGRRGLRDMHKLLFTFWEYMRLFSVTSPIAIPIDWDTQHAHLGDLDLMDLRLLRKKLLENREYWKDVDRNSEELRECTNYWICPSERILV